jgi:hypothetical protein
MSNARCKSKAKGGDNAFATDGRDRVMVGGVIKLKIPIL